MSGPKLHELFEFSAASVQHGLAEHGRQSEAAAQAAPSFTGFVAEAAAKRLNETLNVDVFEMLAEGWLKFKQVRDCADPGKHGPDDTSVVPLRAVEISSSNTVLLHAHVTAVKLPELRFTLELVAKFAAVDLVIRAARIRALRPGACSALVRLKYGAVKLAEQATPQWRLPSEIVLGSGLPIPWGGT